MKEHLTHYKKVKITKDISLRFFYTYQDRKHFENKWILKCHSTKTASIVNNDTMKILNMLHPFNLEHYQEIRGKIVNNKYHKIIIKANGKIKEIVEEFDN